MPYDWTDLAKQLCQDRCGMYGEPPCWDLHNWTSDCTEPVKPCDDCAAGRVVTEY